MSRSTKRKYPSQQQLQELFFYDNESGLLHWKIKPGRRTPWGKTAGSRDSTGYIVIGIDGEVFRGHKLIWIWNNGNIPEDREVDHIDRNRSNNRLDNLRLATARQQEINKNARGFIRIPDSECKPWRSYHRVDRKWNDIGYYPTALQARLAYEKRTSELEPEFASTFFTDAINHLLREH